MRHIDIDELEPLLSATWKRNAAAALKEVQKASAKDRAAIIQKHAQIWRTLRSNLKKLSKKCWYCESLELRSDQPVDHFRPKGAVRGAKSSVGYWWLAFDWRNYRLSCVFCNSRRIDVEGGTEGGKWDYFPLFDETTRVNNPAGNLDDEEVILLDPTIAVDPGLLTFDEDGTPRPAYRAKVDPDRHRRAKESITMYHLHHGDAVEARRKIAVRVKKLVRDGSKYYRQVARTNTAANYGLHRVMQDLLALTKRDAPFSAAARAFISGYRNFRWVDQLMQIR